MTLGLVSDPMTNSHYNMKARVKFVFIQLNYTVPSNFLRPLQFSSLRAENDL
jgi:hypothetical protein